jgi:hypothetical protein
MPSAVNLLTLVTVIFFLCKNVNVPKVNIFNLCIHSFDCSLYLLFIIIKMRSFYVAQPGLKLLSSSGPLASVSQLAGTAGAHHDTLFLYHS